MEGLKAGDLVLSMQAAGVPLDKIDKKPKFPDFILARLNLQAVGNSKF
jgi:hypothetical protein